MINKVNPRSHRLFFILSLAALLAGLLSATPAKAQSGQPAWSTVDGAGGDVFFEDVFMISSELAWAVGRNQAAGEGYAYRLQLVGGRWELSRDARFPFGLYGVAATGPDDIWAVGDQGQILRRSRDGWRGMESPAPTATLRDIQVLGAGEEAWAVGDRPAEQGRLPVALRYRNGAWERAPIDAPEGAGYSVNALHLGGGGGWAVGSLLWRLEGGSWRVETMPNLCGGGFGCANGFSGVRAIDADRAWAVGSYSGNCGICTPKIGVAYREGGAWRDGLGEGGWPAVMPPAPGQPESHYLMDVYFTGAERGMAIGYRNYRSSAAMFSNEIFALHYVNEEWRYEQVQSQATSTPTSLFLIDASRGLAVGGAGLVLSYGYGPQSQPGPTPADRVPNPNQAGVAYFPETGHTLRGAFRGYWERYGGLEQFGFPLTEEFSEGGYTVQYFERARFEYHPENAGTRYEVLLGLLGNDEAAPRRGEAPFQYQGPSGQPGSRYFPETGHNLAAEFVGYWERYGGLPIYGYPVSEPFYEVNQADGRTYLVQYFERNRFEYHPENAGTRYEVLLGLLGAEALRDRGWLR